MFSLFTSITGVWCWHCFKNRQHAQRIHYLMAALGVLKALTLMSQVGPSGLADDVCSWKQVEEGVGAVCT